MEADLHYYRRRAAEERVAAAGTTNPKVRDIHLDLARRYDQRVDALTAEIEAKQLRLVPVV